MKVTKKTFRLAVERNRAKRLVRESFRLLLPQLADEPWDLVVVPRRGVLDVKEPDLRREMSWACGKLGLKGKPESCRDGCAPPKPERHDDPPGRPVAPPHVDK